MFLQPGPFDWLNGVVGITLLSVVFGYERQRPRDRFQSIALAFVCGFCSLLILGLVLELHLGKGSLEGIPDQDGKPISLVPNVLLTVLWGIVADVCYVVDRLWQKRIDKPEKKRFGFVRGSRGRVTPRRPRHE